MFPYARQGGAALTTKSALTDCREKSESGVKTVLCTNVIERARYVRACRSGAGENERATCELALRRTTENRSALG